MIVRNVLRFLLCICFLSSNSSTQTNFSQDSAHQILKHFSLQIGPRPMGSPAEQKALRYAVEKFLNYGCDTAYIMQIDRYIGGNTSSGVAVGIKYGYSKKSIVIGGHIDSSDPEIPGTNDDASGCTVVLETARISCNQKLNSTLVFCCFGGEEKGLVGSKHFVRNFKDIDSVKLMIQLDMADGRGPLDIDPDAHKSASAPRWLVSAAIEEYAKLGYTNLRYPTHFFSLNYSAADGPGSDHEPFLQKGIPAIAFISDVSYPVHTPQDNFENFDPVGLKRSGDVVQNLIKRFDNLTPQSTLENYWLYMAGSTPIFFSYWMIWLLISSTIVLAIISLLVIRKRRKPKTVRWSGLKLFFFTIIIISFGWLSPNIIAALKGVRHSWFIDINLYYILSFIGAAIGGWIALRFSSKIRLSDCPYFFFKRGFIFLTIYTISLGYINPKLGIEPAAALLLISLAILIRNPFLKMTLLILSPIWMLRLIFSEWSEILFHEAAKVELNNNITSLIANGTVIFLLSIYMFPFLLAFAAAIRDSEKLKNYILILKSYKAFSVALLIFIGITILLVIRPSNDIFWQKDISIEQNYDLTRHVKNVTVKSSEYLNGFKITHPEADTLICSKISRMEIIPGHEFDTTWTFINRKIEKQRRGDTNHYDIQLHINTKFRPYTVSISYGIDKDELRAFDTPYQFRTKKDLRKEISWYSFPDTDLVIPVKFSTIGRDTIKENIQIIFNKLAYPVSISGDKYYIIPRTKYLTDYFYSN
ncbi:MAG: M28 family peptidase [Ignavibacteriales bacterium]|nr:M28 family peptidase [Ignavibacteriales bacterium]